MSSRNCLFWAIYFSIFLYYYCSCDNAIPRAVDQQSLGNIDTMQEIHLAANLNIPDGGELLLPIEVPESHIVIDGAGPPKVVNVYTPHENGTFSVGEKIDVHVEFTSAVTVTGTPKLLLKTGCHSIRCHTPEVQSFTCSADSGKFSINFSDQIVHNVPYDADPYTLQQYMYRLSKINKVEVSYSTGGISACTRDGNTINMTFTSVNIPGDNGDLPNLILDNTNKGGDGTVLYHGSKLVLTPLAVEVVKGNLYSDRFARFSGKVDDKTLKYEYIVQNGDSSSKLDYAASDSLYQGLDNTTSIRSSFNNVHANLQLPIPNSKGSLGFNNNLVINVSPPTISSVSSTKGAGTYGIGEKIYIQVVFSSPVVVTGSPYISLETGALDRTASYSSASNGGLTQHFLYQVKTGDSTALLTYISTKSFQLNGGTVKRKSSTPTVNANLTLPEIGTVNSLSYKNKIAIRVIPPTVESVFANTSNGIYTAGDRIIIAVKFSDPVVVTGMPVIYINTGSNDLYPGNFVFRAPTNGDAKVITFPHVQHDMSTSASKGIKYKIGSQIMTVVSVSGDKITMEESYTGTAVVTPSTIGGTVSKVKISTPGYRPATYKTGSGTTTIYFEYYVREGDASSDLDFVGTTSLVTNSGSIKRLSDIPTTDAVLTLPTPGQSGSLAFSSGIQVSNTRPTVTAITCNMRDGTYRHGDALVFSILFSLPVVLDKVASLSMAVGNERYAVYTEGNGTTSFQFKYVVSPTDTSSDLNYNGVNALKSSFGTVKGYIRRKAMTPILNAVLTLPSANAISSVKNLIVNSAYPYVLSVNTDLENGSYGVGQIVDLNVKFSEAVAITGTGANVLLETGTIDRKAVYLSGTGSNILVFRYTVMDGDITSHLSYNDIYSLNLNSGTLKSLLGNSASITLPSMNSAGSLYSNKQIKIDTTAPYVERVSTRQSSSTFGVGDTITIKVDFNSEILVYGTPGLVLQTGNIQRIASFVGAENRSIYLKYVVQAGDATSALEYGSSNSLRCVDNIGLNKAATKHGTLAKAIIFDSKLYLTWTESSGGSNIEQIRVAVFNSMNNSPRWFFVDGALATGLNKVTTKKAFGSGLVIFNKKLYCFWHEVSGSSSKNQIRIAVYSGSDASPTWAFVDGNPSNANVGINKASTNDAQYVTSIVFANKLYLAWYENDGTRNQIRVIVYGGNDASPTWTFVDGNHATNGINKDASNDAKDPYLLAYSSTQFLVFWGELNGGVYQIRCKMHTLSPSSWVFIDGNLATGLNVDTTKNAYHPAAIIFNGKVYVSWSEKSASVFRIRIKVFNMKLGDPSWKVVDGSGLNFNSAKDAINVKLFEHKSTLYATWEEASGVLQSNDQIRVARYNGDDNLPKWFFVDGGLSLTSVNDNVARDASHSILFSHHQQLYSAWEEKDKNSINQIRVSVLNDTDYSWLSVIYSCIKRRSTSSTTPVQLSLPPLGRGSLSTFNKVSIDTTSPRVVSVQTVDNGTFGRSQLRQTVDIYGTSTITTGSFRLQYGGSSTACIGWNALATGSNSVQSYLQSLSNVKLSVNVVKDTSAHKYGHRYVIDFTSPTLGVKSITHDLTGCTAFACTIDGSSNCAKVQVNVDKSMQLQKGMITLEVVFTSPVAVASGTPTLVLETGTIDRQALYTSGGQIQEIDVGINAPSPLLAGGYKLSYNGVVTKCIDVFSPLSIGPSSLIQTLNSIRELNTFNVSNIVQTPIGNGMRYRILFRKGGILPLVVADSTSCIPFSGQVQTIDIFAASAITDGGFKIVYGSSETTCIAWNAPAKGPSSVEQAISKLGPGALKVDVEKDPSSATFGHRYYVHFLDPDLAKIALKINLVGCTAFKCGGGVCSVLVNKDYTVSRSKSTSLFFQYNILLNDLSNGLSYSSTTSLSGNIYRASTTLSTSANLVLPFPGKAGSLSMKNRIVIKGEAYVTVLDVNSPTPNGNYGAGDSVDITVTFSASVYVFGVPILVLDSGGIAKYQKGNGTAVIHFSYLIKPLENSLDLDYFSTSALKLNGGKILKSDSLPFLEAILTLPAPTATSSLGKNKAIVVDTNAATITGVSSSIADNTVDGYGGGEVIDILVSFSKEIIVTGTPSITLETGATDRTALYSLAGRKQIVDVGVWGQKVVTGGQFAVFYGNKLSGCIDYNDADSSSASSFKNRLLAIPEISTIGITSVTKTTLQKGFRYTVLFSSTKTHTAPKELTPALFPFHSSNQSCTKLTTGTLHNVPVERSLGNTMSFRYIVASGDSNADLDYVNGQVILNGGSIKHRTSVPQTDVVVTLPTAGSVKSLSASKNIKIDAAIPKISAVTLHSISQTYGVGFPPTPSPTTILPGQISFSLTFSHTVIVYGQPVVELATGSVLSDGTVIPNRYAKYTSGNLSKTLLFVYTIETNDKSPDLDFVNASALQLNDGSKISRLSTLNNQAANLMLPYPKLSAIANVVIDPATIPSITSVTSNHSNGAFGVGEEIYIEVKFSKKAVMHSGLNINKLANAYSPRAVVFNNRVYVIWNEYTKGSTSLLQVGVYNGNMFLNVANGNTMNRVSTHHAVNGSLVVFNSKLYASWSENMKIYTAVYNGNDISPTWQFVPVSAINRVMNSKATEPFLVTHNLKIHLIWKEEVDKVGQIRVASFNSDDANPLWNFLDGDKPFSGINLDPLHNAHECHAASFRGILFVTWSEYNGKYYEIQVARYLTDGVPKWQRITRKDSTNIILTDPNLFSLRPRLVVKKASAHHISLHIMWQSIIGNKISIQTAELVTPTDRINPYWAVESPTIDSHGKNSFLPSILCLNANIYTSWSEYNGVANSIRIAASLNNKWQYSTVSSSYSFINHNEKMDALDSYLFEYNAQMGIIWTEYDGISIKLRMSLNKSSIYSRSSWKSVSPGTPRLKLETGTKDTYAYCIDKSGESQNSFVFLYVVEEGQSSADLEYHSNNALEVNSGLFLDSQGSNLNTLLAPKSTTPQSLSFNKDIIINTNSPTVIHVTSPVSNGEYGVGERIDILVKFSMAVVVIGFPYLTMESSVITTPDRSPRLGLYKSGSETDTLLFQYLTIPRDHHELLSYSSQNALVLNGSKILQMSTLPSKTVSLTLPPPGQANSLSKLKTISVKSTPPIVTSITSLSPDGTYYGGDTISVLVSFSLPVCVYGRPYILLHTDFHNRSAFYKSGNNSQSLRFEYTVQIGDKVSRLSIVDDRPVRERVFVVNSLHLNYGSIKRKSTFPFTYALLDLPAPDQPSSFKTKKKIVFDTTNPIVERVTTDKPNGAYDIGEIFDFYVTFSAPVVLVGYMELLINTRPIENILGTSEYPRAKYVSGNKTKVFRFQYTITQYDHTEMLDYIDATSLRVMLDSSQPYEKQLHTGSLKRLSTRPLIDANISLAVPGPPLTAIGPFSIIGSGKKISIRTDGLRVIKLRSRSSVYTTGDVVSIDVHFGGIVIISGIPRLELNVKAATTRYATYVGGSNSSKLQFNYTVSPNDNVEALDYNKTTALQLNGGKIVDNSKGAANVPLTLPLPGKPGCLSIANKVKIDTASPKVIAVFANSPNGSYGLGDEVDIAIKFSRPVVSSSSIALALETGATDRNAKYKSGNKTSILVFMYTVANGDATSKLEYKSPSSLLGVVKAFSYSPSSVAINTLPALGSVGSLGHSSSIVVITSSPTVKNITSLTASGTYKQGDVILIKVMFSYRVSVSGAPQLTLYTKGLLNRVALYAGGHQTDSLVFKYVVKSGDSTVDLDYATTNSLSGTIKQFSKSLSVVASLTLPPPGSPGSLSFNKDLSIYPNSVFVTSVTSSLASGEYGAGQKISISVIFSEKIAIKQGSFSPYLKLSIGKGNIAKFVSGNQSTTLVFEYIVLVNDMANPLEYSGINALKGIIVSLTNALTPAALTLPEPKKTNSLSANKRFRIDSTPPRVVRINSLSENRAYGAGDIIYIQLHFSSPVVVTGKPKLLLETGLTDQSAIYVNGTESTVLLFLYIVQSKDMTERLDYKPVCHPRVYYSKISGYSNISANPIDCISLTVVGGSALNLNGGSIKRLSSTPLTDANLELPEPNPWPYMRELTESKTAEYITNPNSTITKNMFLNTNTLSNEVYFAYDEGTFFIYSNGIPDHSIALLKVKPQSIIIEMNRFPIFSTSTTPLPFGFVGVLNNGILLFNSKGRNYPENSFDSCGGHANNSGEYFYINFPKCTIDIKSKVKQIVGFAFDGFPIYSGEYDESGNVKNLDECNGKMDDHGSYGYHLIPHLASSGIFLPCFRGSFNNGLGNPLKYIQEISLLDGIRKINLKNLTSFTHDNQSQSHTWINPKSVSVSYTTSSIIVLSNGIPDGIYGPFPNAYNPHTVESQNYAFDIPRNPKWNNSVTTLPTGIIGIMINGIPFYNSNDSLGNNVMDSKSPTFKVVDKCNGFVDISGAYRYYASPECLLEYLGDTLGKPSPLIGYAFDGYPVFGPYGMDGKIATNLDECNGKTGPDGKYRYHVKDSPPYIIGCYHGEIKTSNESMKLRSASTFLRSLSYNSNIKINTASPKIVSITTTAPPDTYVFGEIIEIYVKFSAPVVVNGYPYLLLQTGSTESPTKAKYDPNKSLFTDRNQIVFLYSIGKSDNSKSLNYFSSSSLVLNGSTIRRLSKSPSTDAKLTLANPNATTQLGTQSQIIQSIAVNLRGLYHQSAGDLEIRLFHEDRNATIVNKCCSTNQFGRPDTITKTNRLLLQKSIPIPTSGVGFDYTFMDQNDTNLALFGTAAQSSTLYDAVAHRAIDGIRNGFFSKLSVTHTEGHGMDGAQPWWQVRLLNPSTIRSIKVWNRQQEPSLDESQVVSIDASVKVVGNFKLTCINNGVSYSTDFINYNAVAMKIDEIQTSTESGIGKGESFQSKLEKLTNVGQIHVTRSSPNVRGGYSWTIIFLGDPGNLEMLQVKLNNISSSGSVIKITSLVEGNENKWYNYNSERVEVTSSLFPCWVMVFGEFSSMAFDSLKEAKRHAIWKIKLLKNQRETSVSLPLGIHGQYVRVQLESSNYLTLAEVEIFGKQNPVLSHYSGGSPVTSQSFPRFVAWSPENSFTEAFGGSSASGMWTLSIKDRYVINTIRQHGIGALSDWVLTTTNVVGTNTTYFMDVIAKVETLPKYGSLYVNVQDTQGDFVDEDANKVLDSLEVSNYLDMYFPGYYTADVFSRLKVRTFFLSEYQTNRGLKIAGAIGQKKPTVGCYGDCSSSFGTSSYMDWRSGGDVAALNTVWKKRNIRYLPKQGYLGNDEFTYSIILNSQKCDTPATIKINVVECRDTAKCDID